MMSFVATCIFNRTDLETKREFSFYGAPIVHLLQNFKKESLIVFLSKESGMNNRKVFNCFNNFLLIAVIIALTFVIYNTYCGRSSKVCLVFQQLSQNVLILFQCIK